jgi:hypothetical protein
MAEETTISTPVDSSAVDTSSNVEPETTTTEVATDTSTEEPTTADTTAETETQTADTQPETLYAGKYKSIEELEKGYKEAEKSFTRANELEKKYNELIQKQQTEAQQVQAQKLQQAQARGFNSVEQQEIHDKVQLAEFEYYANNIQQVPPEYSENARQALLNYYNTANTAYLEEAKRYFSSNFIENVAVAKQNLTNQLNRELSNKRYQQSDKQAQELATVLKADYADFLADVNTNEGKSQALKAFCDVGSINSKEDMQIFQDIYSKIANYERTQAIKEYEAQKAIDKTKQASQISTNPSDFVLGDTVPTYAEIAKMTQKQFDEACRKFGEDKIILAK